MTTMETVGIDQSCKLVYIATSDHLDGIIQITPTSGYSMTQEAEKEEIKEEPDKDEIEAEKEEIKEETHELEDFDQEESEEQEVENEEKDAQDN